MSLERGGNDSLVLFPQTIFLSLLRMPSIKTQSAAGERAAETNGDLPTSASSIRTRYRLRSPDAPYGGVTLSNSNLFEPEEGEIEEIATDYSTCSSDTEEGEAAINSTWSAADEAMMQRELERLQEQKAAIEKRTLRMRELLNAQRQLNENNPETSLVDRAVVAGPRLPVVVKGFGRNGTRVNDHNWRPNATPSTTELPRIHQPGWEEQEVESLLLREDTREDLDTNPGSRASTPQPGGIHPQVQTRG